MDFKVIWSDEAITDLRDICSYIARDNPEAAVRMGNGILDHVRILAQFPFIGPAYPRGAQGPLREIVFRSYRIFYDVSEEPHRVDSSHLSPFLNRARRRWRLSPDSCPASGTSNLMPGPTLPSTIEPANANISGSIANESWILNRFIATKPNT